MEYRTLPCSLTDDEVKQIGDIIAMRIEELDQVNGDRKATADRFKERLKEIHGDIAALARQLRTRREDRVIACMWERDDARFSMLLVRQDTGEIVMTRPMFDEERQVPLGLDQTVEPTAEAAE